MIDYRHLGHPKDRFEGPLQLGWHGWYDEQGKTTGIVHITRQGEFILGSVDRTPEETRERMDRYARAVEGRRRDEFQQRAATARIIGEIWNKPIDY